MSEETKIDDHSPDYENLKKQTTLEEILQTAVLFENIARDFYTAMIPKVSKNIRFILQELAEEEAQHAALFSGLKDDPNVLEQLHEKVNTPAQDYKFSDYTHMPQLTEPVDEQTILLYALGRESAAMNQYQDLADNTPEGPLNSVFQFLAFEEARHMKELENKYAGLIPAGESGK